MENSAIEAEISRPTKPIKAQIPRPTKPLTLIENQRARRITYIKRKDCIKKKTMELATLCGIQACTVVFGPDGEVETWPENPAVVKSVIQMSKKHGGGGRRRGKKSIQTPGEKIMGLFGWDNDWLSGLSGEELGNFSRGIELKLQAVERRIASLNGGVNFEQQMQGNSIESLNVMSCEQQMQGNSNQGNSMDENSSYYWPPMQNFEEPAAAVCRYSSYFPVYMQPLDCYGNLDQVGGGNYGDYNHLQGNFPTDEIY